MPAEVTPCSRSWPDNSIVHCKQDACTRIAGQRAEGGLLTSLVSSRTFCVELSTTVVSFSF